MAGFFEKIKSGAGNVSKAVKEKAEEVSTVSKINREKNEQKQKITEHIHAIGEAVYAAFKDGTDVGGNTANCEAIQAAQLRLGELEVALLHAKGIKKCPQCGKEIELNAAFCQGCGAQQEIPTPPEPEAKQEHKEEEKFQSEEENQ